MPTLKTLKSFLALAIFALATSAHAVPKRIFQDLKLPTQQMVEKFTISDPIAALATRVVSGAAGPTSAAAATLTTFTLQPDVPRNITVTPGGTTGDVEACVVTIAGTNYKNAAISEDFTFIADASTVQTGNKAFKTVTSASWAASCESGGFAATWSIGVGEKLGLNHCLASAGHLLMSTVAGAYESTRATMAVSASTIESNTADFNGTMNGSNDFEIFYFQNFLCL